MKKFQVIADSTSDLEKKFRDEYEIDYFKMNFTISDTEYSADLDWTELSPLEYYTMMRNGKRSITSFSTTEVFINKMKEYLDKGLDILYIACSTKLSGTRGSAEKIANELLKDYPERRVVCYDSLRSNYSQGLMAIDAAKLALEGKSMDEVVEYLDKNVLKYQVHAIVGSLEWLKKAGRVKASKAFFGTLMQVKPVICSDAHGNNYAYEKVFGRKKSIERLLDIVVDRFEDPENHMICIEHADCQEEAEYVAKQIEERCHPKAINISSVGPIIGATVGPDTITVSFFGKEVAIFDQE